MKQKFLTQNTSKLVIFELVFDTFLCELVAYIVSVSFQCFSLPEKTNSFIDFTNEDKREFYKYAIYRLRKFIDILTASTKKKEAKKNSIWIILTQWKFKISRFCT